MKKIVIIFITLILFVGCTKVTKPYLLNEKKLKLSVEEAESIRYCMLNPEKGTWLVYNEDVSEVDFELEIYLDDLLHYWMDGDLGLLKNHSGLVMDINREQQLTETIEKIAEEHGVNLLNKRVSN